MQSGQRIPEVTMFSVLLRPGTSFCAPHARRESGCRGRCRRIGPQVLAELLCGRHFSSERVGVNLLTLSDWESRSLRWRRTRQSAQ
jgi:hypothetical protein